jgi:hypothetical protein
MLQKEPFCSLCTSKNSLVKYSGTVGCNDDQAPKMDPLAEHAARSQFMQLPPTSTLAIRPLSLPLTLFIYLCEVFRGKKYYNILS